MSRTEEDPGWGMILALLVIFAAFVYGAVLIAEKNESDRIYWEASRADV